MSKHDPIEAAAREIAKVAWRRDSMRRRDAISADEFADNYWRSYEDHVRAAIPAYLRARVQSGQAPTDEPDDFLLDIVADLEEVGR